MPLLIFAQPSRAPKKAAMNVYLSVPKRNANIVIYVSASKALGGYSTPREIGMLCGKLTNRDMPRVRPFVCVCGV